MKEECIKRMKELKLSNNCIKAFENDKIWLSEGYGALYELEEEELEIVNKFESKTNNKVYHVIHDMTEFGELYSLLFVSKNKDEWKEDFEDLKNLCPISYVYNKTYPELSEYGSIMVFPNIGGLIRRF